MRKRERKNYPASWEELIKCLKYDIAISKFCHVITPFLIINGGTIAPPL